MSSPEVRLRPVVLKNDVFIVVSFSGSLDQSLRIMLKDYKLALGQYMDVGAVIFDFTDTTEIHMGAFSALSALKSLVHEKGIELRICEIPQTECGRLVKQGIFRQPDIFPTLSAAMFPKEEAFELPRVLKSARKVA